MYQTIDLRSRDDLNLFACHWSVDHPQGVICLVHGIGEHSARYAHVAAYLNQAGYNMVGYDLRGHGRSGGQRGHIPAFESFMDDIELMLSHTRQMWAEQPLFLYGHSLGGSQVINYLLRRKPSLAGAVATGPALRIAFEPPAAKVALGRFMNNLLPKFSQATGLEAEAISRDASVVQAYVNDPLVHDRISARFFVDTLDAGYWALAHASELSTPLLLMHGSDDRLTSAKASQEFAARAGSFCNLKIWDGLYHEIHNEPEQGQVFDYLRIWLDKMVSSWQNSSLSIS
jgi:alpha-beta hydrolase superfamily lysophospholipase